MMFGVNVSRFAASWCLKALSSNNWRKHNRIAMSVGKKMILITAALALVNRRADSELVCFRKSTQSVMLAVISGGNSRRFRASTKSVVSPGNLDPSGARLGRAVSMTHIPALAMNVASATQIKTVLVIELLDIVRFLADPKQTIERASSLD
jgi:hypothetical protein